MNFKYGGENNVLLSSTTEDNLRQSLDIIVDLLSIELSLLISTVSFSVVDGCTEGLPGSLLLLLNDVT